MKKYLALLPMVLIVLGIFYDAANYMYTRYLLTGGWSVGTFAPASVFFSAIIILGLAAASFGFGISNILEEKK